MRMDQKCIHGKHCNLNRNYEQCDRYYERMVNKMERSEIENKLKDLVFDNFNINGQELNEQSSIIDDLGMDSLDLIEFRMWIEEDFGIEINEKEADQLKTVKDIINLIESKVNV